MMLVGLFGGIDDSGSAAGLLGGGAAPILFGVSLFSPRLVRPLASVTGRPLERLRGLTGRLARENAMRKPGRTASTAAALMIGLALVVFVTVFAAGINSSVGEDDRRQLPRRDRAPEQRRLLAVPARRAGRARGVDGVSTVSSITYATGALPQGGGTSSSRRSTRGRSATCSRWTSGAGGSAAFAALGPRDTVLDDELRARQASDIGDTLRVRTPTESDRRRSAVLGTVKGQLDLLGKALIDESATRQFGRLQPNFALARLDADASPKDVQKAMDDALKDRYPTVEVQNQSQLKDQNRATGEPAARADLRAAVAGDRGVAVRDREHAGAVDPRAHARARACCARWACRAGRCGRMVRYEAVITALIGAILGMVLGCVFAALVSRPLADEGFRLSYPVGTLIVLLVLAALAGVVAAIGPARRASRLDVLRALAYE